MSDCTTGAAGVLADGLQGRDERGIGGQGRSSCPGRLPLGQAGPRRGDRQPHQAGARHRIGARHAQPIAPAAILELRRAEVVIDRFQRLIRVESVPARRPEAQKCELRIRVVALTREERVPPRGLAACAAPRSARGRLGLLPARRARCRSRCPRDRPAPDGVPSV